MAALRVQLPKAMVPVALPVGRHSAVRRTRSRSYTVNVTNTYANRPRESGSSKIANMVDPLVAKRLAAEEMQRVQARAKLKRRQQIEAINGGWAMLGLTAGIVIEGHTGKSIVTQVTGYAESLGSFLSQWLPPSFLPDL